MGVLGALFTIREWWWLYALGIWLYMTLIPAVEASEQTVIQKVVPFQTQGRVFGFAQAFESAAAPVTAFLIAPIAQFWIIPYMELRCRPGRRGAGCSATGEARGIALVFLFSGLAMVVIALLAFTTRSYRMLSEEYRAAPEQGDAERERRRRGRARPMTSAAEPRRADEASASDASVTPSERRRRRRRRG